MIDLLFWLAIVIFISCLMGKLTGVGIDLIDFFMDLTNRRRKH